MAETQPAGERRGGRGGFGRGGFVFSFSQILYEVVEVTVATVVEVVEAVAAVDVDVTMRTRPGSPSPSLVVL
jgi:hypothetical protein